MSIKGSKKEKRGKKEVRRNNREIWTEKRRKEFARVFGLEHEREEEEEADWKDLRRTVDVTLEK